MTLTAFACFSSSLAGKAAQACKRQQTARRAVRCNAQDEQKSFFESNRRAAVGYTDEDSAGQSNIFAVEPKVYVSGSSADNSNAGPQTVTVAAAGFVFAMAAIGAGLIVMNQPQGVEAVAPTGEFRPLSEYAAKFSAELGPVSAAPAVAEAAAEAVALSE
ncbi:hypothetical protein N2152v2_009806 [Parachlorella kessleri]